MRYELLSRHPRLRRQSEELCVACLALRFPERYLILGQSEKLLRYCISLSKEKSLSEEYLFPFEANGVQSCLY